MNYKQKIEEAVENLLASQTNEDLMTDIEDDVENETLNIATMSPKALDRMIKHKQGGKRRIKGAPSDLRKALGKTTKTIPHGAWKQGYNKP